MITAVIATLIVISSVGISCACNYNLPPGIIIKPVVNTLNKPSINFNANTIFTYYSCPNATSAQIHIHIDDDFDGNEYDIIGNMDGGPSKWTYNITFAPHHGAATVTFEADNCSLSEKIISIYIDPAGYIYDIDTGARISNASVWLQRPDGIGGWENVTTGEEPPVSQPDINPLISDQNGMYQWDVLNGSYRVHVEAPGYEPKNSTVVSIPPPVYDLNVGLHRIEDPVPPIYPVANFSTNVISGYAPLSVQFTDNSTNTTGRIWNFGDGNLTYRYQYPFHKYYAAGNYTVNLTATNGYGNNSTTCMITVWNKT